MRRACTTVDDGTALPARPHQLKLGGLRPKPSTQKPTDAIQNQRGAKREWQGAKHVAHIEHSRGQRHYVSVGGAVPTPNRLIVILVLHFNYLSRTLVLEHAVREVRVVIYVDTTGWF